MQKGRQELEVPNYKNENIKYNHFECDHIGSKLPWIPTFINHKTKATRKHTKVQKPKMLQLSLKEQNTITMPCTKYK